MVRVRVRVKVRVRQTHQVHFPVRYDHEHGGDQVRGHPHDYCTRWGIGARERGRVKGRARG